MIKECSDFIIIIIRWKVIDLPKVTKSKLIGLVERGVFFDVEFGKA